MTVSLIGLWLLVHTLFAAASEMGVPSQDLRSESREPLWEVDLEQNGFLADKYSRAQSAPADRMIAFSNPEEVVVLDQTFEKPYQSTVRAFVLDAKSGSLRKRTEWTMRTSSGVFPVRSGGYAVLQEQGTALYGRGFEKSDLTTSPSVELVSPNGGRLAGLAMKNGHSVWITLDPETLTESGIIPGSYQPSISENAVAKLVLKNTGGPILEVIVGEQAPVLRQLKRGAAPPKFVSEDLLALVVGQDFEVISVTGAQLFTGKLKYDWHQFASCRDGSKMAVVEQSWSELKGRVSKELIRVFDLMRKTVVWSTTNEVLSVTEASARSGVALSPDCSLVAIKSMSLVRVFRLP